MIGMVSPAKHRSPLGVWLSAMLVVGAIGCYQSKKLLVDPATAATPLKPGNYHMLGAGGMKLQQFSVFLDAKRQYSRRKIQATPAADGGAEPDLRFYLSPLGGRPEGRLYVSAAIAGAHEDPKDRTVVYGLVRFDEGGAIEELVPDCAREEDRRIALAAGSSTKCDFDTREHLETALSELAKVSTNWNRYAAG